MATEENRGTKRKRYQPPQEDLDTRIVGKLHHEIKEVHKASKKGKTFEIQKVVKRLKDSKKKEQDAKGLEEELTCLKDINHDAVGNAALKSKLLKDRILRQNEVINGAMTKELGRTFIESAPTGTTLAKIQSRLLSSKILAAQVAASLESLRLLLNPVTKALDLDSSLVSEAADPADRTSKSNLEKGPKDKATPKGVPSGNSETTKSNLGAGSEEVDEDDSSASEDEEALEVGGWESGSISNEQSESEISGDDGSDDDNSSQSDDETLQIKKKIKTQTKKPDPKPAKPVETESMFLPSLSVGFVRGDSDSDWSEAEGKAADPEVKKNRRGQRARRAIWEKKFGRNANHKKKEAAELEAKARNPRGHTSVKSGSNTVKLHASSAHRFSKPDANSRNLPQALSGDAGWASRSSDTQSPAAGKRALHPPSDKEKSLHPSWEAKRKLKERESAGIVPSQGKKITFS